MTKDRYKRSLLWSDRIVIVGKCFPTPTVQGRPNTALNTLTPDSGRAHTTILALWNTLYTVVVDVVVYVLPIVTVEPVQPRLSHRTELLIPVALFKLLFIARFVLTVACHIVDIRQDPWVPAATVVVVILGVAGTVSVFLLLTNVSSIEKSVVSVELCWSE